MSDVLVIGDSVEAVLAAIFARRRGAAVGLCPRPRAVASGPVTFELLRPAAADILASRFSIEDGMRRACDAAGHPYRALFPDGRGGADALGLLSEARHASEALRNLLVTWGAPYDGEVHEPRVALTELGTLSTAGLGPASAALYKRTALPDRADVVALAHDPSFPGRLVAAGLSEELPGLSAAAREVDLGLPVCSSPLQAAAAIPWALLLEKLGDGAPVLVAPRRLGKGEPPPHVRELLPVHAPSAPAVRLQAALAEALDGLGVTIHDGEPQAIDAGASLAVRVATEDGGAERLPAGRVIVAPGKFARGGLASAPRVACPLLPVPVGYGARDEERIDGERHFDRRMLARHDAFRIGVRIDGMLRPLGEDGAPWHPRVHVAGTVIGGADAIGEGSGLALLTAWLAAHRALEAA